MTTPPPAYRAYLPSVARILFFIGAILLFLFTLRVSGVNGLAAWLGWAGLTSVALGLAAMVPLCLISTMRP